MIFKNDKVYNILKWIALVVLPALTTFYGVVGATLKIPHTQEVLTIATAFITMLGTILGVSNVKYNQVVKEFENEKAKTHEVIEED